MTFNETIDPIHAAVCSGKWWIFPVSELRSLRVIKHIQLDYYSEKDADFAVFVCEEFETAFKAVFVAHKARMSGEQLVKALRKYVGINRETQKITPEQMDKVAIVGVSADEEPAIKALVDVLEAWENRN